MTLVDSSVWIAYFNGARTAQTFKLDELLGREPLAIGDLMLTEVLQGFGSDRDFERARRMLTTLTVVDMGRRDLAIEAARNFRRLRSLGITVRKTIDSLIATFCIANKLPLLHADRDFDPFARHLSLAVVAC